MEEKEDKRGSRGEQKLKGSLTIRELFLSPIMYLQSFEPATAIDSHYHNISASAQESVHDVHEDEPSGQELSSHIHRLNAEVSK